MSCTPKHSDAARFDERLAFEVWFGRTIRHLYEPVMHEPLPDDIIRALSRTTTER